MDVIEQVRNLGKAIQADERFVRYAKARLANDNDKELQAAIGEFNIIRMQLDKEISSDEKDDAKVTELNEKLYAKKAEELKNSILTFISEEGTYNFNGNSIQLRWIGKEIKEVFLYFRELKKTYSNLLKKKADLPVTKFYN